MLSNVVVGFAALRRPVGPVTTTTRRRGVVGSRRTTVVTACIDRTRRGNGVHHRHVSTLEQGKELSIHLTTVHSRRRMAMAMRRSAASPRGMNGYSYNGGDGGGYDAYSAGSRRRGYDDDEEDYDYEQRRASRRGYDGEAKTTTSMNRDEAMFRAMGGIFATACGVLRWGLPLTGGLACWAAAAANTGDAGLLSALSGSLLVGTTLGVCVLIFAAASATMSGASLLWMMAKKYFVRGSGVAVGSGRSRRRNGGMYEDEAPRRRRSPLQSRRDDDDDDERQKPQTRVSKSFSFSDWTPEVPIVDPRAPGKWGGRQGVQGGDAYAWGTHKTPADFRREMREEENRRQSPKTSRDDDDYPSTGPSEWRSRAAYRAKENGMMSSNADVGATPSRFGVAVVDDPREALLKKFEPRERLLPRTPPKPKHAHIPTEVLIAMGGASLETHIGRNAKDILKTNKSSRRARLNNDASRRGASTAVSLFGFGSGDAPRKSSNDNDVSVPRPPSNSRPSRDFPSSSSSSSRREPADEDWQDEIARRARERFERNLSSTFDLGDGFIDDDDEDDDPMDRLRRTR